MAECAAAPGVRPPTDHVYYSLTKGLCAVCKGSVDAKIVFRAGAVHLDKFCPSHGHERAVVASSAEWFIDSLSFLAPSTPPAVVKQPVAAGCPFDCGPCELHQQKTLVRADALPARIATAQELRSRPAELVDEWLRGPQLVLEIRTDARTTTPDLQRLLIDATGGVLAPHDFVPSPLAHPLCYSICVVNIGVGGGGGASLGPAPQSAGPIDTKSPNAISYGYLEAAVRQLSRAEVFARLTASLYLANELPWWPGASRMKAVYIHDLMDAERFDVSRVMRCPVSVVTEDDHEIPACADRVLYEAPADRAHTLAKRARPAARPTRALPVLKTEST